MREIKKGDFITFGKGRIGEVVGKKHSKKNPFLYNVLDCVDGTLCLVEATEKTRPFFYDEKTDSYIAIDGAKVFVFYRGFIGTAKKHSTDTFKTDVGVTLALERAKAKLKFHLKSDSTVINHFTRFLNEKDEQIKFLTKRLEKADQRSSDFAKYLLITQHGEMFETLSSMSQIDTAYDNVADITIVLLELESFIKKFMEA